MRDLLNRRSERLKEASRRVSNIRAVVFFGVILFAVCAWGRLSFSVLVSGVLAGVIAFVGLLLVHGRLEERLAKYRARIRLWDIDSARQSMDWARIPAFEVPATQGGLPSFFQDLDLVGEESFLQLIDTTVSEQGRHRLMTLFLETVPGEGPKRRAIVRELERLRVLRMRFRLASEIASDRRLNSQGLRALAAHPIHGGEAFRWTWVLGGSQLLALGVLVLAGSSFLPWIPKALGFAGYLFTYAIFRWAERYFEEPFERALAIQLHLSKFRRLSRLLEEASFRPTLRDLLRAFSCEGQDGPAKLLTQVDLCLSLLGAQSNPLLHFLLNLVVPWDFAIALRLESVRQRIMTRLPEWIDAMAEFEAFASLASYGELFARTTTEPRWLSEPGRVEAKGLAHPLIPPAARVGNNLALSAQGTACVIITGSNMSGKSTWLRTVGVNSLLALAGGRVVAREFALGDLRVEASLRKGDRLADEVSTFYAEVKRLKEIFDVARGATTDAAAVPVLYLIDEIFQGTNNRERLAGSRAYIEALLGLRAVGLVATHDLELAELESGRSRVRNQHFRETLNGFEMSFTYELRDGPCPSTNALRIMELAGLPVGRP
jgi:hypothetical protein